MFSPKFGTDQLPNPNCDPIIELKRSALPDPAADITSSLKRFLSVDSSTEIQEAAKSLKRTPFPDTKRLNFSQLRVFNVIKNSILSRHDSKIIAAGKLFLFEGSSNNEKVQVLRTIYEFCKYKGIGVVNFANIKTFNLFHDVSTITSTLGLTHKHHSQRPQLVMNTLIANGTAERFKSVEMIIIYNANSIARSYLECLDVFLQNVMGTATAFGGLTVVLSSDFKAMLPLDRTITNKSSNTLYNRCFLRQFRKLELYKENFKPGNITLQNLDYAGIIKSLLSDDLRGNLKLLPEYWAKQHVFNSKKHLFIKLFENFSLESERLVDLERLTFLYKTRRILCPTEQNVDEMNLLCLSLFGNNFNEFSIGFYLSRRTKIGQTFSYNNKTGAMTRAFNLKRLVPITTIHDAHYFDEEGLQSPNILKAGTQLIFLSFNEKTLMISCRIIESCPPNESSPTIYLKQEKGPGLEFVYDTVMFPPVYPVVLGFASSIYSVQGYTFEKIGIDCHDILENIPIMTGKSEEFRPNRLAHVAFNCANSDDGIYLVDS